MISVADFMMDRYRRHMNWSGKGFLGVYAEWLEPPPPAKPESKAETLRELRERRYRMGQAKAAGLKDAGDKEE